MRNNYLNSLKTGDMKLSPLNEGTQSWQKQFSWTKRLVFGFVALLLTLTQTFAQERIITGKVIDASGVGVPGVSVYLKGTTKGTTTDAEGKYSLAVTEGATLVLQSLGYATQEIVIAGQANLDLTLEEDTQRLNEIVVVGYGTQEKKDVTGSLVSLGTKDFNQGPITNPLQQLVGRAAGVNVNQVGSEPGNNPSIRIRGITSLAGGNDPLVVVDGIQGSLSLLNQIPPSEIETMDILKDASATAIYGSRGAAGVILVTTKKSKEGKTTLEYSAVGSVETIAKKYDVLSAAAWREEAAKRGIPESADFGGNTDWFKEVTRTGYTQNHNLAFGGGNNNFSYRASLTAILQDGIVINSNSRNYIGRVQATQRSLNDKLTLTYNVNLGILEKKFNNADNVISGALSRRPTDPIYKSDGSYFTTTSIFNYVNPYARAKEIIDGDKTNSLFGSVRADYEIIQGLTASAFGSWRRTSRAYGQYQSPRTTTVEGVAQNGVARRQNDESDEQLLDLIADYKKTIGDHSFGATFVYEWQKQIYSGFNLTGRGVPNLDLIGAAIPSSVQDGDNSSYKNDRTLISYLGRVNYSYKGKYLLTASFRRDGASVFGPNNKWGNFPSVSVGWRLSEEGFIKNLQIFDNLKLRAGFGVTGNQQGLGPLNSVLLASTAGVVFFNGQEIRSYAVSQNANKDLRWETREMFNAGIDFAVLKGKLSGTVDFYYGTTKNLLFRYNVPVPPFQVNTIFANVGKILNQGLEISLNYTVIDSKDLRVNLAGNFTTNRTEVQELSGNLNGFALNTDYVAWGSGGTTGVASTNNDISYLIKGQPIGTFYLFKHGGVDGQGNQIIVDVNKNGKIDDGRASADRAIVGQALPKFTYAFTPSVSYKSFDLSFVFRGGYGNKIYNARRATLSAMGTFGQSNVLTDAPSNNISNINYASDFWLENGSFARMENLTVGYRFNTTNMGAIQAMRISFTSNNLFIITKYKGIDPEVNTSGGSGAGIDYGIYPRTRNFAVGLNITLK